jgi:hypothetical protein
LQIVIKQANSFSIDLAKARPAACQVEAFARLIFFKKSFSTGWGITGKDALLKHQVLFDLTLRHLR